MNECHNLRNNTCLHRARGVTIICMDPMASHYMAPKGRPMLRGRGVQHSLDYSAAPRGRGVQHSLDY